MGAVWLVHDAYLAMDLALKLLPEAPGAEEVGEIQREFALLARLEHPGLARARDFGYLGARPYFTREFVPGEAAGAGGGPPAIPDVLRLARDIAEVLGFLHGREVLHLDVKPGNIIVDRGARSRAVLIDFGLCRRGLAAPPGPRLKGSLPYMAPEYFRGGPLGPPADVYALGATIYRLLTGRFPRPLLRPDIDLRALAGDDAWGPPPAPPSQVRPGVPADLDHVVLKCLALDPRLRFRSGAAAAEALAAIGAPGTEAAAGHLSSIATIGREAELARADRFLDAIAGRRPGSPALLVAARPGMGATHFLRELKIRAQTRSIHAYLEAGFPGRAAPPGSVLRCLSSHIVDGDGRSRWEEFLARLGEPRRPLRPDASEGERRLRRAAEVALAAGAIREPLLLAVDDLQFADEVSIALVIDLIRFLSSAAEGRRLPLGIAAAFREEGPSIPLLRELAADLLPEGKGEIVTLGPLGVREAGELYRSQAVDGDPEPPGRSLSPLTVFTITGGCPRSIVDLAAGRAPPAGGRAADSRVGPDRSSPDERRLVAALDLLARPAAAAELARATRLPRPSALRLLEALAARGALKEVGPEAGAPAGDRAWTIGDRPPAHPSPAEARRLHARLARELVRGRPDGPRLVEATKHFRLAGDRRSVVRHGLPAARWLRSTFQSRAALDLLGAVLSALPEARTLVRLEIAGEMADLRAEVGDFDAGIRTLQEFLPELRGRPGPARLRTLLRLATLHARAGDFERADALFAEELREAREPGSGLAREEVLFFLNEHAMVKAFKGDYGPALRLCEEGLGLAGRGGGGVRAREMELNLHATRANVALRTFDFPAAIRDFTRALEIAEAVGSPVNQAVVLSNLGIAYSQCDRYEEAIRALAEAERLSRRLDEGPSLTSIYGNLAVLHSKRGDFEAAERALAEGERIGRAGIGQRQQLFLEHARGLALVNRGRYAEAQPHLEAAARIGTETGDRHVAAFDEVYLAEAHLFQARYAAAAGELDRLAAPGRPARIRKMALARRALLGALTGRDADRRAAAAAHASLAGERPIPFLDAGDDLILGWAASIAGDGPDARPRVERAERFFRDRALAPGLSLARWVQAEALFLAGDVEGCREALAAAPPGSDLVRALHPLLAARAALSAGNRSGPGPADLLAEAGAALIGNPLPEWAARIAALRALVRGGPGGRSEAGRRRRELAGEAPAAAREAFLRLDHWRAWTAARPAPGTAKGSSGRAAPDEGEESPATAAIDEGTRAAGRSALVARSRPMRRLARTLDRLRGSDLPVLIGGETGTGKELVARAIHAESRRSDGPFLVIDPAAIPAGLLEAELFGAKAGAFTDIREDRRGLLALAAGGTVLLDGIAEVGPEVQAKLLRAIAERRARPIGGDREEPLDVRFLFSTSRDLRGEVREGRFRGDLFHRLAAVTVEVPPLRERPEDLPGLVEVFLAEGTGPRPEVMPGALERLRAHRWPGNVRELKNVIARLRLECPRRIEPAAIDRLLADPDTTSTVFPRSLLDREGLAALHERLERDYIVHHFRRLGGSTEALRRFLGLGPRQLYRRCGRLGISLRAEKAKIG